MIWQFFLDNSYSYLFILIIIYLFFKLLFLLLLLLLLLFSSNRRTYTPKETFVFRFIAQIRTILWFIVVVLNMNKFSTEI